MPHKSSAWKDIIYQDDLKLATENLKRHMENPDHPYDQIVRYLHKNGSTVWIRCRGLIVRDEKGKPIRMIGAHQDITSLKESEIKLQKLSDELKAGNEEMETSNEELKASNEEMEALNEDLVNMHYVQTALSMFSKDIGIIKAEDGKEAYKNI